MTVTTAYPYSPLIFPFMMESDGWNETTWGSRGKTKIKNIAGKIAASEKAAVLEARLSASGNAPRMTKYAP